jgi:dynein heavy chain 1
LLLDKYFLIPDEKFLSKIFQLYNIQLINHGVIIVGAAGCGKTIVRKILFEALQRLDKIEGFSHVIYPKTMSKENLYGWADSTTREWTDGVFTKVLRDILANVRGVGDHRHWIIFDGDVDPEWVENLNSVFTFNRRF